MAFSLGSIFATIGLDMSNLVNGLKASKTKLGEAGKDVDGLANKFTKAAKVMTVAGVGLTAAITAPLLLFCKKAVQMAMDVEEIENLFVVSMGNMAEAAEQWSEDLSQSLGLNKYNI